MPKYGPAYKSVFAVDANKLSLESFGEIGEKMLWRYGDELTVMIGPFAKISNSIDVCKSSR